MSKITDEVFNDLKELVLNGDEQSERAFKMALNDVERKVRSQIKERAFDLANKICDSD